MSRLEAGAFWRQVQRSELWASVFFEILGHMNSVNGGLRVLVGGTFGVGTPCRMMLRYLLDSERCVS